MKYIRVTRSVTFDMAHALPGHGGKCRNIHGHRYKLTVSLRGIPGNVPGAPDDGMVADFNNVRQVLKNEVTDVFDHSLVLPEKEGEMLKNGLQAMSDPGNPVRLILTPFQPTAENLLVNILSRLNGKFGEGVKLVSLKLFESENACAEWHLSDQ